MPKGKKADRLEFLKKKYQEEKDRPREKLDWFKPKVEDVYLMKITSSRPVTSELYPESEQTMYVFADGKRAFSLSGYAMRAMNDVLAKSGFISDKVGED